MSYGRAMGLFALTVLLVGAVVVGFGPEDHRVQFGRCEQARRWGLSAVAWLLTRALC